MDIEEINKYTGAGILKFIKPFINGTIDSLEIITQTRNYVERYNLGKIEYFIELLKYDDAINLEDISDFTDKQISYFMESIKKTINADDLLQIFIISKLTKEFFKNGQLNYHQLSLFYNISQISDEDFKIYKEIVEYMNINKKDKYTVSEFNDEVKGIVIEKFINIGLFMNYHELVLGSSRTFIKSKYTNELVKILEEFESKDQENR